TGSIRDTVPKCGDWHSVAGGAPGIAIPGGQRTPILLATQTACSPTDRPVGAAVVPSVTVVTGESVFASSRVTVPAPCASQTDPPPNARPPTPPTGARPVTLPVAGSILVSRSAGVTPGPAWLTQIAPSPT